MVAVKSIDDSKIMLASFLMMFPLYEIKSAPIEVSINALKTQTPIVAKQTQDYRQV
jgi:hypothetical protein